jgi:hypothetical protein
MKWSRRNTVIAGLVLIGLTNAVVLAGAGYNRSGEPDSRLSLTERELRPPYAWEGGKENSGLALELRWRVLQEGTALRGAYAFYDGGSPAWLDAKKMAELGFDTKPHASDDRLVERASYRRQLPREVFVVLEMDGPAYAESLARTAAQAKQLAARSDRADDKKADDERKAADEMLEREAAVNSRLFAVDAGLDRGALRARFADRGKYAIVRARVRPIEAPPGGAAAGFIDGLSVAQINVPREMRSTFDGLLPEVYGTRQEPGRRFDAQVAFGQRLEPWLARADKR